MATTQIAVRLKAEGKSEVIQAGREVGQGLKDGYQAAAQGADAATAAASDGAIEDGELVGQAGLEARYDDVLRGRPGRNDVLVDARGVVTQTVRTTDPVPGQDLLTTLDATVQRRTQEALARGTRQARARGVPADEAAAVVLDLRDGGVVASASVPTYDPSVWTGGISARDYEIGRAHV